MWYSSVYSRPIIPGSTEVPSLSDVYWAENMTKPMLFQQAMSTASAAQAYDLIIEIGPHPALKGTASQTAQEILERAIPYKGTLARHTEAVGCMSAALGFLWTRLGESHIDLEQYSRTVSRDSEEAPQGKLLKGLPTYSWDHEVSHWHESRRSRQLRTRKVVPHSLLGDLSPDSAPHSLEWRNLFRPNEMPWLDGHRVQGQIVFPAAGIASAAFEAARHLAASSHGANPIRLLEMNHLEVHQALAFNDEEAGVEVLFRLQRIESVSSNRLRADFVFSADLGFDELTLAATASVEMLLGEPSSSVLPERRPRPPYTISVDKELL